MRELTEYEKEKWLDEYGRFIDPLFLFYGDELGEAYELASRATHMGSYGLSDEFVKMAIVETLDMYYHQILVYAGQYGDEPEELLLPPIELLANNFPDVFDEDGWPIDDGKEAWDWAMEWRDEHWEESNRQLEKKALEERLSQLNDAK